MDAQAIQTQIMNEYNEFLREIFPYKVPEWFLQKFPIAIMSMSQSTVPYHAERIQQILTKTPETLTIFETGLIVNVLLAVKPEIFGWGLEEFLMKRTEVEAVRNEYAEITKKEEARLARKGKALSGMGGQHNGIIKPFN